MGNGGESWQHLPGRNTKNQVHRGLQAAFKWSWSSEEIQEGTELYFSFRVISIKMALGCYYAFHAPSPPQFSTALKMESQYLTQLQYWPHLSPLFIIPCCPDYWFYTDHQTLLQAPALAASLFRKEAASPFLPHSSTYLSSSQEGYLAITQGALHLLPSLKPRLLCYENRDT